MKLKPQLVNQLKANEVVSMERRVPGNRHARCEPGEKPETISRAYLSVLFTCAEERPFAYFQFPDYKEYPGRLEGFEDSHLA